MLHNSCWLDRKSKYLMLMMLLAVLSNDNIIKFEYLLPFYYQRHIKLGLLKSFINPSATRKVQLLSTSATIINGSLSGMNTCGGFKYKSSIG